MIDAKTIAQTCVMQSVRAAARHLTRRYEEALKPETLTASQFSVLVAISLHPGIKVTTVAEHIGMDRTTLNRVLAPLGRRGLVRLESAADDARAKAVFLEPEGEAVLTRAIPLWTAAQEKTLAEIGPEAWDHMQQSLKTLRTD